VSDLLHHLRMAWHVAGRWRLPAQGLHQPQSTPLDLEYNRLQQSAQTAPAWWTEHRLPLQQSPSSLRSPSTTRLQPLAVSELYPLSKASSHAVAAPGLKSGNYFAVQMGLDRMGHKFEPIHTPAAKVNTAQFSPSALPSVGSAHSFASFQVGQDSYYKPPEL